MEQGSEASREGGKASVLPRERPGRRSVTARAQQELGLFSKGVLCPEAAATPAAVMSLGPCSHLSGRGEQAFPRQNRSARPTTRQLFLQGPGVRAELGSCPRPICQGRYRQVRVLLSCWVGMRRAGRPVPGRRSHTPRPPARAFPGYTVPEARHTCARVCTDMDAHTYTHIHMHTHTRTHTHPCSPVLIIPNQLRCHMAGPGGSQLAGGGGRRRCAEPASG